MYIYIYMIQYTFGHPAFPTAPVRGQETTGAYLVWDVPPSEVPALAARASRLRIQQRDAPEMAVESRPECCLGAKTKGKPGEK